MKKSVVVLLGALVLIPIFLLNCEKEETAFISNTSIRNIDFNKEWKTLKDTLNLNDNAKLNFFYVTFNNRDRVENISIEIIEKRGSRFVSYKINSDRKMENYTFDAREIELCIQYDNLVNADYFFSTINSLQRKYLIPDGDYETFDIFSTGRLDIDITGKDNRYIIKGKDIVEAKDKRVEGFHIAVDGWNPLKNKSNRLRIYFFNS